MSQQSNRISRGKGLCLLSLDAGGTRGISQLEILVTFMHRLNSDTESDDTAHPCDVFDMIGGTGSGGFIAILLVVLGLTAKEAFDEFLEFNAVILDKQGVDEQTRTTALKNYINVLLKKYKIKQDAHILDVNDRSKGCKVIIPISYKNSIGTTCRLRNFNVREEQALNLTVADAILTALATPSLFASIPISKDAATFNYIGGDIILGNPIRELIAEAHGIFGPEARVACLFSLGCGHPGVIAAPKGSQFSDWIRLLERLLMDSEEKARVIDGQMGHLGLYYRFSVSLGLERSTSTTKQEAGDILTHTSVYLDDHSVSRNLDRCVKLLKTRDGIAPLGALGHSVGESVSPPGLPPVTRTFVMRRKPWEFIERKIFPMGDPAGINGPTMLAVTGIGGCGKTEIILKFMQVHKSKFTSQFLIDGSSKDRIRSDVIHNVRALGIEHSEKTFEDCLGFLGRSSPNVRRLLLYDNVDDPDIKLAPLIPLGDSCVVIVTSRNRSVGLLCPSTHLELDVMSLEEAVDLLLHSQDNSIAVTEKAREEARAVAEALGCLPVALMQARSFIYETKCSSSEYLKRLCKNRDKLLAEPVKHQWNMRYLSTYAAFEASFDELTPHVQSFLRLLSCVHRVNFPFELLEFAAERNFSGYERKYIEDGDEFLLGKALLENIFLQERPWDVTNLDKMVISLQNYSLATVTPGIDTRLLQMHPILHEWVHSCIPDRDLAAYRSAAILLLALGARDHHTPSAPYLASHVTHLSSLWEQLKPNEAEAFGLILQAAGLFEDSVQLRKRVVIGLTEQLDPGDASLPCSKSLLASAYRDLGRFTDAEELQHNVWRSMRSMRGELHPDTITASSDLALTYRELGRFNEAKELQETALRLRKEIQGERHLDTIKASNNLALTYHDLGLFSEAEALQAEVLRLRKEISGKWHLDTVSASAGLAIIYHDLGRFKEAEELQAEVLRVREETLGKRHPLAIDASSNLAVTYQALERFEEARLLQEDVVKLREEILGERHPDSLMASNNLADFYHKLGRFEEAEIRQVKVVSWIKEALGERHPNAAIAMLTLAEIYESLGRQSDALIVITQAISIISDTLGEAHPLYEACQELACRLRCVAASRLTPIPDVGHTDPPLRPSRRRGLLILLRRLLW